jgi:hypothetical protein
MNILIAQSTEQTCRDDAFDQHASITHEILLIVATIDRYEDRRTGGDKQNEEAKMIMTAQTDKKTDQDQNKSRCPGPADLDRRYGKIGIPAVAAALKYCTAGKKRSTSPTVSRIEERFFELAA